MALGAFLSILTSPATTYTIILLLTFTLVMLYNHYKPEKYVELLRPRDGRGKRLPVIQETDLGLVTSRSKGVIHRFFKVGRGWVFNMGGKMTTKYFGIEGTAYTAIPKGDEDIRVSVSDFLKHVWGDTIYAHLPPHLKRPIETDVVGITIDIGKISTGGDTGLMPLTADNIIDEEDAFMLKKVAGAQKKTAGQNLYQWIIPFVLGMSVMFFVITKGFI